MENFVTEMLIKPQEIHSALEKIWGQEGQSKMRASLFNLIFYTEETARADYFQKIAEKVVEKFPSRLIFITAHPGEQGALVAKVSVISSLGVACDVIKIDATGPWKARIPFVILPHILPDLPVYLIWAEDPARKDPLFSAMQQLSTRLIFDSESARSLQEFARALLKNHSESKVEIADLNWARLESFRDVLTSTFFAEEKLQELKKAQEIKITYNAQQTPSFSHTNIQAIYLQNWLSTCLQWNKQPKFLLVAGKQEKLAPGMILEVEITTESSSYHFLCHTDGPQKITLTYSTADFCEMPVHFLFPKGEKGQSLVKEICHSSTSQHYVRVLQELAK